MMIKTWRNIRHAVNENLRNARKYSKIAFDRVVIDHGETYLPYLHFLDIWIIWAQQFAQKTAC